MPNESDPNVLCLAAGRKARRTGIGNVSLVNCTDETFLLIRAKGSGKLRSAGLVACTESGEGFVHRLCEPGWRASLGPRQVVGLAVRAAGIAGHALFSLQTTGGKALASLSYQLEPGPEGDLGVFSLQPQAAGAADLLLVPWLPEGIFLLARAAHRQAMRQLLAECGEPPAGPDLPPPGWPE